MFVPGIVPGLVYALKCFTCPGDKILIQTSVYHLFRMIIEKNQREVVYNPLELKDGKYHFNAIHFREAIKDCKLFILCNPHNPRGKVWSREDLIVMADICYDKGVLVLTDEIHADLSLSGFSHTSFATVSESMAKQYYVYGCQQGI